MATRLRNTDRWAGCSSGQMELGPMGTGRNTTKDGAGTGVRTGDQRMIHVNPGEPSCDFASAERAGPGCAKKDTLPHSMRPADAASVQIGTLPHSMRPADAASIQIGTLPHSTRPADAASVQMGTLPHSTRPADAASVQTDTLPQSIHPTGGCGALPGKWDSLCPDVRQVVLSKVPLRDLAPMAATCREFREEFRRRLGEEQERLIGLGEERYGKDCVSRFLKSVQQSICGVAPDHGIVMKDWQCLLIKAAGELELVTHEVLRSHMRNGSTTYFSRRLSTWGHHIMTRSRADSGCECVGVRMDIGWRRGFFFWEDEADVGVLLAFYTRNREAMPSRWRSACEKIPVEGWKSGKVKGSLGSLANTFFLYDL